MSIAVVLLHYNRWANLRFALRALQEQTLPLSEFHVVVADDGSTDETVDELNRLIASSEWMGHLHLVSGGPHHGTRLTRIHNIGIANIPPECSFFLVLASDMCMAPDALEQVARLHEQHPAALMITRLDWLPPKTDAELEAAWNEQGFDGLARMVPPHAMDFLGHTLVGTETRPLRETAALELLDTHLIHPVYGMPTKLFWEAGGYDEVMDGYGWQDLELALRLERRGVSMITTMEIRSLHIWHEKDAAVIDKVAWQRQKNTAYVFRKHGAHPKLVEFRQWKYWEHYHRDFGGIIVYLNDGDGDAGLYALNIDRTHGLQLPHAGWLHPLGFSVKDILLVRRNTLRPFIDEGQVEDFLGDFDFSGLSEDLETSLNRHIQCGYITLQPSSNQNTYISGLFQEYDTLRVQADTFPGANIPLIGKGFRMLSRVGMLGKLWAAERKLLQAMLEKINYSQEQ